MKSNNNTHTYIHHIAKQVTVPEKACDGRIRSFPHVEGNWPSHVYIEVASDCLRFQSQSVAESMKSYLSSSPSRKVHMTHVDEYHVSLSRPFVLRSHHIDAFMKALRNAIHEEKSFDYTFEDYKIFMNDEKTRSFGSIMISQGKKAFVRLICMINRVLIDFRGLPFYENPEPHVSVAWHSGPCPSSIKSGKTLFSLEETDSIRAIEVICKIGKKKFVLPLQ